MYCSILVLPVVHDWHVVFWSDFVVLQDVEDVGEDRTAAWRRNAVQPVGAYLGAHGRGQDSSKKKNGRFLTHLV